MATLTELADIRSVAGYDTFVKKIRAAIAIKAHAITELQTPTQAQLDWAKSALIAPDSQRQIIENYVIAANSGVAVATILNASDAAVQNNVNAAVDNLLSK